MTRGGAAGRGLSYLNSTCQGLAWLLITGFMGMLGFTMRKAQYNQNIDARGLLVASGALGETLFTRTRARLAALLVLVSAFVISGFTPVLAVPNAVENLVPVSVPLVSRSESLPAPSSEFSEPLRLFDSPATNAPNVAFPNESIEIDRKDQPVGPGLTLTSFDRLDSRGWLRGDVLTVDLGAKGIAVDYLFSGKVAQAQLLTQQATRNNAIAAVNGDFFDMNNTNAPLGIGLSDGKLIQAPVPEWNQGVGVDRDGIGRLAQFFLEGTVTLPDGQSVPLTQFNSHLIADNGIGAFTPLWGVAPRARAVMDAPRVTEVLVVDGKVAEVRDAAGEGEIPETGFILLGREVGADTLRTLKPGDAVSLSYRPRNDAGVEFRVALGGRHVLVKDGVVQQLDDTAAVARTAIGFSADGKRMYLATVDGRSRDSRGMTLQELAHHMRELGVHNALNVDGGGSSTLGAREPGSTEVELANTPSDGVERPVPNGFQLSSAKGSGRLTGYWVQTAIDATAAPTVDSVPGGHPDRVFPGLTRRLEARGHDETYAPVSVTPRWRVAPVSIGWVDRDSVFHADRSGTTRVTAASGSAHGSITLTVLDPLARIDVPAEQISLPNGEVTGQFGVVGHDRQGFTAPIEPSDIRLSYDTSLLDISSGEDGMFTVKARKPSGSVLVTARVGEHAAVVPVTVGLEAKTIANLDDGAQWKFSSARGSGSVAPVSEGHTGPGLKLAYDFTQSTATRTANASPPRPIVVQGQPQALGIWVYGHGKGEWTAFRITDAQNQAHSLYGPYITWNGWKYLEVPVPRSVTYPISLNSFSTIETKAEQQYTSEVIIDDLIAKVGPPVEVPPEKTVIDSTVVIDGTVDGRPWRFAVMSDAQFVAADPDSKQVQQARRTLREILAAKPDFLVINGDFVDTGNPQDFDLARKILTEEIGDRLPWHYVPGNHEILGSGTIGNFTAEFGEPYRFFDHKGTRFVLLDSSAGSFRGGSFDQILMLKQALDKARTSRSITSVIVMAHHPPRDPSPVRNSQLSDRKEAALVERWLADFQQETGKQAAYVGAHAGLFHASHVDGIPYLINGNSGKTPAAPVDKGGFTGWTMVGVDPPSPGEAALTRKHPYRPSASWFAAEIRPHVDLLRLDAPERIDAGKTAQVKATLDQAGRPVPVGYPISADWGASPNVHIGSASDAKPRHVAVFDPSTGKLTALRSGAITLAVTVNGVTQRATIDIADQARQAA